jgi:hypothetical protein
LSFWVLLQIFTFLVLIASSVALWARLSRPPKDDPKLSRGLQILQSKIAILEDLSDRTDKEVRQLMALLEQKAKETQQTMREAEQLLGKIEASAQRSLEVAKIFQDKIPHQEIIERQNTLKYVRAAKLAYAGKPIEEIAQAVDLPRAELEFIVKVNRQQLQFNEADLPEWAVET